MKVASSLKSLKKRDLNSKLVKRRGKVYIINKKIPSSKLVKVKLNMNENDHKNTWEGFKICSLGHNCRNKHFSNSCYNFTLNKNFYDCRFHKRKFNFRKKSFIDP